MGGEVKQIRPYSTSNNFFLHGNINQSNCKVYDKLIRNSQIVHIFSNIEILKRLLKLLVPRLRPYVDSADNDIRAPPA